MKINQSCFQLKFLLIGILFIQIQFGFSQEAKSSALYKTIMSKDSLLFDIGFNTCDAKQFENLFSDELEFYHDKDGFSNKVDFLNSFKNGLCGSQETYRARRELVTGSIEIYPLYKKGVLYAAIQTGIHQFYETTAVKDEPLLKKNEKLVGKAKFTHLWVLENNDWKLKRALSYDHSAVNSKK
ncbi:nuclear transport factor 2 family protein [Flavobacterium sp. LHD-85]|uniref:nuclear transport factor 2 family protein n=1 Tax=Flavobacterium sp. LHD-85 TaxID=3071410 RepID=UPI0027E169EC|nr:nuclear transport factor 2 family protein [Flavobacterium sp. LHD-85]MDQ6531973.1 nuclear transport factor 2 family protein [Flavobacterium sp. LHD-85]